MTYNIRKFMQVAILAMGLVTICNLSAYEAEINKLSATMAEKIAAAIFFRSVLSFEAR